MVLEHTQQALSDEIEASKAQLQPHLETLDAEQLQACGIGYGDVAQQTEIPNDPENHAQSWLRMFLSEVAMGAPRCVIDSHGEEWPEERALLIEMACNEIATQSGMREFVRRTATDYSFRAANAVCGLRPIPDWDGQDKPKALPTAHRLAFDEYLEDSTAVGAERRRWKAHRVARDVDEVLMQARKQPGLGWDVQALESIADSLPRDERSEAKRKSSVKRRQLVYWAMWEPGFQLDSKGDLIHGTVHYVLDKSMPQGRMPESGLIRKSSGWMGSPIGPYAHSGALIIGDLPVELAPLVSSASQAKFVNDIARAVRDGVTRFKSNTVVRGDDMYGLLNSALNGDIIRAPDGIDVRTMIASAQSGGVSPELMIAFEAAKQSLQRNSGIYDTRQGDTSGDTTATAVLDAQAGFRSTMELYADPYRDFLRQVFTNWAYWADCSPMVSRKIGPLPPEVQQKLGVASPFLETKGGFGSESKRSARDHESLALSIDPFSTRSKNEQTMQMDLQVLMGTLQFIAALGPFAAALDVDLIMRWVARSRGVRDYERVLDSGIMRAIIGMTLGGQATPPAKGTGSTGQRLSFNGVSPGPRRVPSTIGPAPAPQALPQARPAATNPAPKPAPKLKAAVV